ncbi:SGNH/GDSL hydrolase family protein [Pseudomonas sp. HR96]|uniref:SGNH/GDSL hydrolase family protein n=1 Tax=Pseudomonas sp. HR96 TaxID=1027966 RepID=UPI002A754026|nr:SGNH/GDSL hydrolase family protein [Pseudomonas sp. HR96]WPO99304.1 SGNH/GDSL hydrolase family protein [Pseudomonas sp. HR96]
MGTPTIPAVDQHALAVVNPANSRYVGFFGDSRAYLSWSSGGLNFQLRNVGLAHWLQAYGLNAFSLLGELNGGVAGDTTRGMLERQPQFIELLHSRGCTRAVFIGSTNDRTAGIDLGTSKKNVREIVRNFFQAGISVIVVGETPRGNGHSDYELSSAQIKEDHYQMHLWFQHTLSKVCTVLNVWDAMVDPASGSDYYVKDGMTVDGIHMSKIGAQVVGLAGGARIAAEVRQLGDFLDSNVRFHAGNPLGSLTANPLLEGSDGNLEFSAGCGSQLASGWKASANHIDGLMITLSKEVDAEGREWQKVHIIGQSGGEAPQINISTPVNVGDLHEGDRIKATALVKSEGRGLSNVGLALLLTPAWAVKSDPEDSHRECPWPSEPTGVLSRETPMYKHVGDKQTGIEPRIDISCSPNTAIDASVWFAQCGAFKFTY